MAYHLRSTPTPPPASGSRRACPPEDPAVPSVTPLFPTADWQEREVFDFFGIVFDGHPDLRRILMPDEWDGPSAAQGPSRSAAWPRRTTTARSSRRSTSGRLERVARTPAVATDDDALRRDPRGDHDHQHGSAAPVDPRGAAAACWSSTASTSSRCKPVIGYLHTGIEKNTEYRTWQQGVTFVTRADYLSPFFNELGVLPGGRAAPGHRGAAARPGHPGPVHAS